MVTCGQVNYSHLEQALWPQRYLRGGESWSGNVQLSRVGDGDKTLGSASGTTCNPQPHHHFLWLLSESVVTSKIQQRNNYSTIPLLAQLRLGVPCWGDLLWQWQHLSTRNHHHNRFTIICRNIVSTNYSSSTWKWNNCTHSRIYWKHVHYISWCGVLLSFELMLHLYSPVLTAIITALLATAIFLPVLVAVCKCHPNFTPGGAEIGTSAGEGEGPVYKRMGEVEGGVATNDHLHGGGKGQQL